MVVVSKFSPQQVTIEIILLTLYLTRKSHIMRISRGQHVSFHVFFSTHCLPGIVVAFGGSCGSERSPQLWTGVHKKEGEQHLSNPHFLILWDCSRVLFLLPWSILAPLQMVRCYRKEKLIMLTLLCKPSGAYQLLLG